MDKCILGSNVRLAKAASGCKLRHGMINADLSVRTCGEVSGPASVIRW